MSPWLWLNNVQFEQACRIQAARKYRFHFLPWDAQDCWGSQSQTQKMDINNRPWQLLLSPLYSPGSLILIPSTDQLINSELKGSKHFTLICLFLCSNPIYLNLETPWRSDFILSGSHLLHEGSVLEGNAWGLFSESLLGPQTPHFDLLIYIQWYHLLKTTHSWKE